MAHKLIPVHKLTLRRMMAENEEYGGLADGLVKLPVPDQIRIGRRLFAVPQTMEEFTGKICYGQRMFFSSEETNDYGVIIRVIDGYYYPIVTGEKWDQDRALLFGKIVITCVVQELYPVVIHITNLISEMITREQKLLHREPSKMELAAGIEKLNVFSDLSALNFLRDTMKITVAEVLLTPYNECLVRFMHEKAVQDFNRQYADLLNQEYKAKNKKHGRSEA
jgi:hypothetical protein